MQITGFERLFNIKSDSHYFYTGRLSNGHQVLMGLQTPELVLVEFDIEGNFLQTSVRRILANADSTESGPSELDNDQASQEVARWQDEIAFTPEVIAVKAFFLPDRAIGIKNLPKHYQQVLDTPEDYSADRLIQLNEDIRLWRERGDFVLYWNEDYYLNREGEVEST